MATVFHVLGFGASNSASALATPALTVAQAYSNVMFNSNAVNRTVGTSGIRAGEGVESDGTEWTSIVPLVESQTTELVSGGCGESPGSAMLAYLAARVPGFVGQYSSAGRSGSYASLAKGTVPYGNGIMQIRRAHALNAAHKFLALAQQTGVSAADTDYAANHGTWLTDWTADSQTETSQTENPTMLLVQERSDITGQNQHYLATTQNSRIKIALAGFYLATADGTHRTNVSQQIIGSHMGRVIARTHTFTGSSWTYNAAGWTPFTALTATYSGNIITIACSVPVAPIVYRTTEVAAQTNKGIVYSDDSSSVTISSVAAAGTNIVLTMSGTPSGANKTISIGNSSGLHNFCDSDTETDSYGNVLRNYAVLRTLSVTLGETAARSVSPPLRRQ